MHYLLCYNNVFSFALKIWTIDLSLILPLPVLCWLTLLTLVEFLLIYTGTPSLVLSSAVVNRRTHMNKKSSH